MEMQTIAAVVGLIGGTTAIFRELWNLGVWLRDFRTINIEILQVMYFVNRFSEFEVEHAVQSSPMCDSSSLIGKIHEAVTIIEFQLQNAQKKTASVRLMEIDDWIWSDRYSRPMYSRNRDYRVFDLHTKENTSLADTIILEHGDIVGRRIEIAEKGDGPTIYHHGHPSVPETNRHVLAVQVGRRQITKRVDLPEPTEYSAGWIDVHLWSNEELPVAAHYPSSAGAPRP